MKKLRILVWLLFSSAALFGCAETMKIQSVNLNSKPVDSSFVSSFGSKELSVLFEYDLASENVQILDIKNNSAQDEAFLLKVSDSHKNNRAQLESDNKISDCIKIKDFDGRVKYFQCVPVTNEQLSVFTKNSMNIGGSIIGTVLLPIGIPVSLLGRMTGDPEPLDPYDVFVDSFPDPERLELFGQAILGKLEHERPACLVEDKTLAQWYQGECKNWKANGRGVAVGTAHYSGDFVDGKKQGTGEYVLNDGKKRSGYYCNDQECTESQYKYLTDKVYASQVNLENYRKAYQALSGSVSCREFLVNYKSYDPDNRLPQVKSKLAAALEREKAEYFSVANGNWDSNFKLKVTYTTAPGKAMEVLQRVKDAMRVRDPLGIFNPYWVPSFHAAAAYDDKGVVIGEWYTGYYDGFYDWSPRYRAAMDALKLKSYEHALLGETSAPSSDSSYSSSSSGSPDFVMVDADIVAGFSSCMVEELTVSNLNGSPDSSSPGNINQSSSTRSTIYKGYNNALEGRYRWSAKFNCGNEYCSGTAHVSGTKNWLNIRFYKDCRDANSGEN